MKKYEMRGKVSWENAILLQENANVLQENKKFWGGESSSFVRERNCFVSKRKVSHKNSILFRENVNVLWGMQSFSERFHSQTFVFSTKSIAFPSETPGSPTKCLHLFAKVSHYI